MDLFSTLDLSAAALLFLAGAAFAAGFIDSIAGGGGLISLPATLLAGLPPHVTLGTNKLMSSLGTSAACVAYIRSRTIAWKIVAAGIGFSLAGAAAGARLVLHVDNAVLGKILVALLPFAALSVFLPASKKADKPRSLRRRDLYLAAPLCFSIGLYDGFYGPGTGSFLLLLLHFALRMPLVEATATAKPFNLASNLSALTVFLLNGQVAFGIAGIMAVGNILGNVAGSRLAIKKGAKIVRLCIGISLSLLFCTVFYKYYWLGGS